MKSKLFLIYLRYKNPLLIIMGAIAIISVSLNWWGNHNTKAVSGEWKVGEVISGDRFRAKKENQTEMIKLCGISAPYAEAKEDLESLIKRGNGKVYLSKVGNSHEAWVLLAPDYEEQIHLNTWLVQNGIAKHDKNSSQQCLSNENLEWAEALAKEEKVGIWSEK